MKTTTNMTSPTQKLIRVLKYSNPFKVIRRRGEYVLSGYRDYYQSQQSEVNIDGIQTVCMTLGPYRNLTTLVSSLMSLHPHVQVLNHGARRVFPVIPINFLNNYSQTKYNNFLKYAIYTSQRGNTKAYGGDITISHAFQKDIMAQTYQKRYGDSRLKEDIRSLYWKDSMRLTNYLKDQKIDLTRLFNQNNRLRFLLTIRYPPDCAVSNIRTRHVEHFKGISSFSPEDAVSYILHVIQWFLEQQKRYPDHFFHFFENEVDAAKLQQLAHFLQIEPLDTWIEDVLTCYQLKPHYEHPPALIQHYQQTVKALFGTDAIIMDKFKGMD